MVYLFERDPVLHFLVFPFHLHYGSVTKLKHNRIVVTNRALFRLSLLFGFTSTSVLPEEQ